MKTIKVACAIIQFGEKILVVQRSANMSLPLKWEFPGGKIEASESEIDCIKREIKEELHIEIEVMQKLSPSVHQYPKFLIELIPFLCTFKSGELTLTEHSQYRLMAIGNLIDLDWAEADIPIVKELINL